MSKTTLILLSLLITIRIFGQSNENLRKIVTLNSKDTIALEQFDENGKLIFHKIFKLKIKPPGLAEFPIN